MSPDIWLRHGFVCAPPPMARVSSYSILMHLHHYRFQPAAIPTVLLLLAVPLFLALGQWQLGRAAEKEALAAELLVQGQGAAVRIGSMGELRAQPAHQRVELTVRFAPALEFYIGGRKHGGRLGYHVITPASLEDSGQLLLVNRGWREGQPMFLGRRPDLATGLVSLRGRLSPSTAPALALGPVPDDGVVPWGRAWAYLDPDYFAAQAGQAEVPAVLLLDPASPAGFVREWAMPPTRAGMHTGYAIQWFAFALMASLIWTGSSFRKREAGGVAA